MRTVRLNGILDPGEDFNSSGQIEAGNIALVAAVPASAPARSPCSQPGSQRPVPQTSMTTGNDGRARVCVFYPQNYDLWVDARSRPRRSVQGTEFSKSHARSMLDALADDINNADVSPPGRVSPFGAVDTSPGSHYRGLPSQPPPP